MSRVERLTSPELLSLIVGQRWFVAAENDPESAHVSRVVHADDELELALVEVRFAEGTHSTYLVALGPGGEGAEEHLPALARLAALAGIETPCTSARALGVEQSNTSVVLDERFVLKLYRRLEAGPSPEVELLRALADAGFPSAPRLLGVIEHTGEPLEATLAVATEFVASGGTGWDLTRSSLAADDPSWLPTRAHRLGEVTGQMHTALASSVDPHIAPQEASAESVALLGATIDEEIVRVSHELPALADTAIGGRIDELRYMIQDLAHTGPPGLVLRIHGDYHLGQVLWADVEDWVIIDFEGEPGRSVAERRHRMLALRDVAGMLRSFAYAADASRLLGDVAPPAGWEETCRAAFVEGWRSSVDQRLLPTSEAGFERLLRLFELEKLLYELRYELGSRPDWVGIPVAGLERMLDLA